MRFRFILNSYFFAGLDRVGPVSDPSHFFEQAPTARPLFLGTFPGKSVRRRYGPRF